MKANINEESGYDETDEDVLEEVTQAKEFTLKELLDVSDGIENAMDKMLEVDLNLERSTTIWPRHKNDAHAVRSAIQPGRKQATVHIY